MQGTVHKWVIILLENWIAMAQHDDWAINIACKKAEKVFLPQRKEKQTKEKITNTSSNIATGKAAVLRNEETGAILLFHFCVSLISLTLVTAAV